MRLSRAQRFLIGRAGDVQSHWHGRAGFEIGFNPEGGNQRRTMNALIRKGAMHPCGQLTETGLAVWSRQIRKRSNELQSTAGTGDQGRQRMA
jgi:hypothetical protein